MKLFAIYVGGEHPGAHIEIHDVRFAVAETVEDTHAQLRAEWWGTPGTLHIDCWAEIDRADGFDVTLRDHPSSSPERLYFVNLGGYDGKEFAEQHRNLFLVARSATEAKSRAIEAANGWKDGHRDDFYEAEMVFPLDQAVGGRLHIHLTPSGRSEPPSFTCSYVPLK